MTTRQSMHADRVRADIATALDQADTLEARLATGETVYSPYDIPGTPDEMRQAAREIGLQHIHNCMSPEWQAEDTLNISTMEGLGFSDIAFNVAQGVYMMDMEAR